MSEDLIQGSEAWKQARCGSLGASQLHLALAKIKTGWGASRETLIGDMVAERLTGIPTNGYTNAAMEWGTATEPEARAQYSFAADVDVVEVGLVRHPRIEWTHCSPDGLVGERGLLEIKAPNTITHIDTLLGGSIPSKYLDQMMWQMACTGRDWVDYCSYDPRLLPEMRLFIHRVHRNDERIIYLENEVRIFLLEVDKKLAALSAMYPRAA